MGRAQASPPQRADRPPWRSPLATASRPRLYAGDSATQASPTRRAGLPCPTPRLPSDRRCHRRRGVGVGGGSAAARWRRRPPCPPPEWQAPDLPPPLPPSARRCKLFLLCSTSPPPPSRSSGVIVCMRPPPRARRCSPMRTRAHAPAACLPPSSPAAEARGKRQRGGMCTPARPPPPQPHWASTRPRRWRRRGRVTWPAVEGGWRKSGGTKPPYLPTVGHRRAAWQSWCWEAGGEGRTPLPSGSDGTTSSRGSRGECAPLGR